MTDLLRTPLFSLHQRLGAKLVPFAGFEMPVQYPLGILKEHQHVREAAGLFDVSHMGQVVLKGEGVVAFLESLLPSDIQILKPMHQRYSVLPNERGGLYDDLMVANRGDDFYLVINAGCKDKDLAYIRSVLPENIELLELNDKALLALQGPKAAEVMAALNPATSDLKFMQTAFVELAGFSCYISRSGYTGEDGFEISVDAADAEQLTEALLNFEQVEMIGLGARDSLRLESGLCLYGNDLNEDISPIEAGLNWVVSKSRRTGGEREAGFPGSERILQELAEGTSKKRIGLKVEGKAPVRAGAEIVNADDEVVGVVCSGGPAPGLGYPIAMAYIDSAALEQTLFAKVRKKVIPVIQVKMPFIEQGYVK